MPVTQDILERLQAQMPTSASDKPGAVVSIAYQCGNEMEAFIVGGQQDIPARHATVGSRFLVMSITKSLTAVAILRLVETGTLELDGSLSQWLPDIPHATRITLRHLLQHTSGLRDYGLLTDYHEAVRRDDRPWTFNGFLEQTNAKGLRFQPGEGWSYSNIGYMVLRHLLETAGKRSFAELITTEVCRPLNLRHTAVVETKTQLQELIPGYSHYLAEKNAPAVDVRHYYDPSWIATGVAASTASDIVRFYRGLFTGALLSPTSLGEMCAIRRAVASHPRFVTPSYGLGLMADPDCPYGAMYGHNGGGPGYSASAFHFRSSARGASNDVTVAVLSNLESTELVEGMMLSLTETLTARRGHGGRAY
jgi:D-alanyl-D-alanine carboxypeptidase